MNLLYVDWVPIVFYDNLIVLYSLVILSLIENRVVIGRHMDSVIDRMSMMVLSKHRHRVENQENLNREGMRCSASFLRYNVSSWTTCKTQERAKADEGSFYSI